MYRPKKTIKSILLLSFPVTLNFAVKLSGHTKQDFLISRVLNRNIIVQGNPKVYKALKTQLALVLDELKRIEAGAGVDDELLDNIRLITVTLNGMKEECEWTP